MTEIPRPRYHFTPPQNFMNDPNGLVYDQGEYHLFYQHNPFGDVWGHMSWGHAVSHDLVNWKHLPIALYEENGIMIFSGSAVVDALNTSGLGISRQPALIAIYTGHSAEKQTQNMAYSTDRGRSWTKYPGNPLIDIGSAAFRDPKVFWHAPTRQWIMLTVLADERKVRFDGSPDLKRWTHLSDFGPAGAVDGIWECPDLFSLPVEESQGESKWVLKVDVQFNAGAQYFIGDFDGRQFVKSTPDGEILRFDYGQDFYAAQSWSNAPDGRRIWLGWLNNWFYATVIPTSPWRGLFSIPRQLSLRDSSAGLRLIQQPVPELEKLRHSICHILDAGAAEVNAQLAGANLSTALEIKAEFALDTAAEFGIKIRTTGPGIDPGETVVGYAVETQELFVDRTLSGNSAFSPLFAGVHRAPLAPEQGKIRLHIFVDACSVEVFANHGRVVISDLVFPESPNIGLEFYTLGGEARLVVLDVWDLKGK